MTRVQRNRNALLARELARLDHPEDKIEPLYLALLTRQPTANEMGLLRAEYDQFGDKAYDNIIWALINSNQFLFVQ